MGRLVPMWCVTLTLAVGTALFAQTSQPQPPRGEKATAGVVATVAATGCLERLKTDPAASPTDAPPQAPAGVEYVLTRVDGRTASTTAAVTGETATAQPETRYLLLSSPSTDFAPHLNHKVKIVGTIVPQPSEGASPAQQVADPTSRETNLPDGPKSKAYHDNLVEVSSVTMVSRSCDT